MIDYIKLSSRISLEQEVYLRNRIDFSKSYNESTGELESILPNGKKVSTRSYGWIKNIKIELFSGGYIELAGSIHKHYNDGKHSISII